MNEGASAAGTNIQKMQDALAVGFRTILSQLSGAQVNVDIDVAPPESARTEHQVWNSFVLAKGLAGELSIACSEAAAVTLAQILMSETPDATLPLDAGGRDAYCELLRQVLGHVATLLKAILGGEVEIKDGSREKPAWVAASRWRLKIQGDKAVPMELSVALSEQFSVGEKPAGSAQNAPASAASPTQEAASNLGPAVASNLELLLDVTLDATIRFGQKQMLLREILELHPGVAIALDRKIEEPVELLIGDRTVARGEVVIVEGNYGLRITEIISPQQRIESLRNAG